MKKYIKPLVVVYDVELKNNVLAGSNTDLIPVVDGNAGDVAESKEDFDGEFYNRNIEPDFEDEMDDLW